MLVTGKIDWVKVSVFTAATIAAWAVLQGIVPEPWHDKVGGVIAAVAAFIGVILKGDKNE